MLAKEYDRMMEAKGTPMVWIVNYAITCPGMVNSELFLTEEEARAFAAKCSILVSIGKTWDIWNFTNRKKKRG